jgi:hypothetical protein
MSVPDEQRISGAASAYAARGWAVFPLKPGTKEPGTVNGHKDATTDSARVAAMFAPRRDGLLRGIGIATGEPSGLLVVDFDGPDAMARIPEFPPTATVRTPNGRHLYYAGSGRSTVGKLGPGIDTRGTGGYVVAPPTRLPYHEPYPWVGDRSQIAALPDGIARALAPRDRKPARKPRKPPAGIRSTMLRFAVQRFRNEAAEGSRNVTLNREVYHSRHLEDPEWLARLWVPEGLAAGLTEQETIRTVASALGCSTTEITEWIEGA